MKSINRSLALFALVLAVSCGDDRPFLSGYIKRASAGLMTPCDPNNLDQTHTCIVYAPAFSKTLVVYNASAEEMVKSPAGYFPLKVQVGPVTHELAQVMSPNPKFPYILALDGSIKSLYPVRVFQGANKKVTFKEPVPQAIPNPSVKLAAYESNNKVFVFLVNKTSIDIIALNNEEGLRDTTISQHSLSLGVKLSHIAIHRESKKAVVSDEGTDKIHIIDLSNIFNDVVKRKSPQIESKSIGSRLDRIYLSKRDLGLGERLYLAGLEAHGKKLVLVDVGLGRVESEIALTDPPLSGYFPDSLSESCCNGQKNWLQVATLKGSILYFSINPVGHRLALDLAKTVDLTSKHVLGMSSIHIRTMVGGTVEPDTSLNRKATCKNNRKVFLISDYASQHTGYIGQEFRAGGKEQIPIEAQCYSCEGEDPRILGTEP